MLLLHNCRIAEEHTEWEQQEFILVLLLQSHLNKSMIVHGLPVELAEIIPGKNLKEIVFNTPRRVLVSSLPAIVCLGFCQVF